MKFRGEAIPAPEPELIVLTRNGVDYPFYAQAVTDFDEFELVCPKPEPGFIQRPGEKAVPDISSPEYSAKVVEWSKRRTAWMIIKSLSATKDLEWEQVKMDDPSTYTLYEKELAETFSQVEINMLIQGVMAANAMDEDKMHEARKRFLASEQEALEV